MEAIRIIRPVIISVGGKSLKLAAGQVIGTLPRAKVEMLVAGHYAEPIEVKVVPPVPEPEPVKPVPALRKRRKAE
jgi:hypothetical protein